MTTRRLVGATAGLLLTGSLIGGPLALAAPAQAAPVPCVVPTDDHADHGDHAGESPVRRTLDHGPVGKAALEAIEEFDANPRARTRARAQARTLPTTITIPVHVHVIRGTHQGEKTGIASNRRIARTIQVLNDAYAGGKQSTASAPTRFRFRLSTVDRVTRDGWFHAYAHGSRSIKMKQALHRGTKRTLNLYINGAGTPSTPVLGFARFPWQQAASPKMDGVIVNHRSLPWGDFKNFNLGDTVVHEVGHWLGLFHTFQGGCAGTGDRVADTPAEAGPSLSCPVGRDTCTALPGKDPVRNFMNYSYDSCMREFTAGQALRMDTAWALFRQ